MELRDEVKSQFNKCHRLAKKYYDESNVAKARVEYMKCAQLLGQLAKLSPQEKKAELLNRSQKFRNIAEGLQEGTIKVFTDGIRPAEQEKPAVSDKEQREEKAKSLILAEKPGITFADIAGLEAVKENIKQFSKFIFFLPNTTRF